MAGILALARLAGLAVAALVLIWALGFRGSFLSRSSPSASQLDHLYSVLHPLLMVIGFILLSGEAILAHRWLAGWPRGTRASVHLALQGMALGFGLSGAWVKFKGRDGILTNFYSLHSWMGVACLSLFAAQWVTGFVSFWRQGQGRRMRAVMPPWHVFIGLYTYGLAVVTAETGLLEKLTFLQAKGRVLRRSPESTLVNALGLSLALLCGLVVWTAISPKQDTDSTHHSSRNKEKVGHHDSQIVHSYYSNSNEKWLLS